MNYIKKYSPYIYFNRITEDRYSVFITIFHFPGQIVKPKEGKPISHAKGKSILNFEIIGAPSNDDTVPMERYHVREFIRPISLFGDNFDPTCYSVQVNTAHKYGERVEKNRIEVLYEDADDQGIATANDIALDCPYLYLTNPAEDIMVTKVYNPYCLIFTRKNLSFNMTIQENVEDGTFEQELELIGDAEDEGEVKMVEPSSIPANSRSYKDLEPVDGYFKTIIFFNGKKSKKSKEKKKKSKGKLRNISATGNSWG